MRDRAELSMMQRLAAVQRARRMGAEADMAAAAQAEREALAAQEIARVRGRAAQIEWAEHLAGTSFSPEFSRALAEVVVVREAEVEKAAGEARRGEENHAARRADWQRLEAQVRRGELSLKSLRRKAVRKADEKKMAALGDRVTWFWSRS